MPRPIETDRDLGRESGEKMRAGKRGSKREEREIGQNISWGGGSK